MPEGDTTGREDDVRLSEAGALERTAEEAELAAAYAAEQEAEERERAEERRVERRRSRLRTMLVLVILVLLAIAAVIGVFIWRGSLAQDVAQHDTEALVGGSDRSVGTQFQAVDAGVVPDLYPCFGKTVAQVRRSAGKSLVLQSPKKQRDSRIPSMRYIVDGVVCDEAGETVANVALGLSGKKSKLTKKQRKLVKKGKKVKRKVEPGKVVYVYCSFDLDALKVADASFDTLNADRTVAASLLLALGADEKLARKAALDLDADPRAVKSRDVSSKEQAVYTGSTGSSGPPSVWSVTHTYDHAVGTQRGDNSVIRTTTVEFY